MANTAFIIDSEIEVIKQSATPSPPAAGCLLIYPKTDDRWYQLTSGGVETPLDVGETVLIMTSEALTAGDWINEWSNGGLAEVQRADATAEGKEADGFVKASYALGAVALVYRAGRNDLLSGLVPGEPYFLDASPGQATRSVLTGSGNVVQRIGVAMATTTIDFQRGEPRTRA